MSQYGMVIDLEKCVGCHACSVACRAEWDVPVGVDSANRKQRRSWVERLGPDATPHGLASTYYVGLCNHCDNPPCLRVCPTKATFQREDGIVMMDFHRCIGCRYCMAGCPYGSRSFNFKDPRPFIEKVDLDYPTRTKGVVEKCEFCAERLAEGKMPSCVEVSAGAITFGDLDDPESDVRKLLAERFSIRRSPYLGTKPCVYYLV